MPSKPLPDLDHGVDSEKVTPPTPEFHPPRLEDTLDVLREDLEHPATEHQEALLESDVSAVPGGGSHV